MRFDFAVLSVKARWGILICSSAPLAALLAAGHLPAAVLLGCMFAAIAMATHGAVMSVPKWSLGMAQGVVGCLMAHSLQPEALHRVMSSWPLFLGVSMSVLGASALLGWWLMRRQIFSGSTAVWGLAPGAASAMVVMAESYGADVRLVAFMQYLRVAIVTVIAALAAHFYAVADAATVQAAQDWRVQDIQHFGSTVIVVLVLSTLARKFAIPGGTLVLPLIIAAVLQYFGWLVIELPPFVLGLAYAVIGWSIGLRFNRDIILHALRALPEVLMAIMALIVLSGLIAVGLFSIGGHDPMTSYLASSPGGADSVAVIAATSAVDAGFVMAMQLARFLMVLLLGPSVSKYVATHMPQKH